MPQNYYFHQAVALSLKENNASPFGKAFNCKISVGVPLECHEKAERAFKAVVGQVDHQAIGLDVDLGIEPSFENLVRWIYSAFELELGQAPVEVILERGDSTTFSCVGIY